MRKSWLSPQAAQALTYDITSAGAPTLFQAGLASFAVSLRAVKREGAGARAVLL
jgi:hypothetical protein